MKISSVVTAIVVGGSLVWGFQNCAGKAGGSGDQSLSSAANGNSLPPIDVAGGVDPASTTSGGSVTNTGASTTTTAPAVQPLPPGPAAGLRGYVDGFDLAARTLRGWACQINVDDPVELTVTYPTTEGAKPYRVIANDANEDAVKAACGSAKGHRFHVQISAGDIARSTTGRIAVTYMASTGPVAVTGKPTDIDPNFATGRFWQVIGEHAWSPFGEPDPDCTRVISTFVAVGEPCGTAGQRCGKWKVFRQIVNTFECR